MRASGRFGQLRVGYRLAARLGPWTFTGGNPTLGSPTVTVTAKVESVDQYWCTEPPFTVALWMGRAWWVWQGAVPSSTPVVGTTIVLTAAGNPEAVKDLV